MTDENKPEEKVESTEVPDSMGVMVRCYARVTATGKGVGFWVDKAQLDQILK